MVGVAGTAALFRPVRAHTHTCVCVYIPIYYIFFYFDALQLAQMNWPRLERVVVVVTDNNWWITEADRGIGVVNPVPLMVVAYSIGFTTLHI